MKTLLIFLLLHGCAAFAQENPVQRLSKAIQFETVSSETERANSKPFDLLQKFLRQSYKNVFTKLKVEKVNDHALLITWPGRSSDAPVLFSAHQDVVPVSANSLSQWQFPPFSGAVRDGYIWGRGALDDKGQLLAELEAAESLLAKGFEPQQTIYFSFGADEEVGGQQGARHIAELLAKRGVKISALFDEGLPVLENGFENVTTPLALVGVAEKGYLTIRLRTEVPPGHSSMPPRETAIGRLAKAILKLEQNPRPARLIPPVEELLGTLGKLTKFPKSLFLKYPRIFRPFIFRILSKNPQSDALIRTTTAVTMFNAGIKDNVLSDSAEAIVNFRIIPGESEQSILHEVRRVVGDDKVSILPEPGAIEPSFVSSTESREYKAIANAFAERYPQAVVSSALFIGSSDSKHFISVAKNIYRFQPVKMRKGDIAIIHGDGERISVENYRRMIEFYKSLMARL